MGTFFTSDTHFGHKNIIRLCNRPFGSIDEHDATLIANHNKLVTPDDTVYHLGDFSFAPPIPYLEQLNGRFIFIWGNHDSTNARTKLRLHPATIGASDYLETTLDGHKIVLCHYAFRVWNKSHHGSFHFFGHSHGTLIGDTQSCDIGVDVWDYKPVTFEQIKRRLSFSIPRNPVDHHTAETNP